MTTSPRKFYAAKRRTYLAAIREGHKRTAAARMAGVSTETVRITRLNDPVFAAQETQAERDRDTGLYDRSVPPTAKEQPKPEAAQKRFDAAMQKRYLEEVRAGVRRVRAAKNVGISYEVVRRYGKTDPTFRDAVAEAEDEALEPVEDALYELALSGHFNAQQVVLQNRSRNWDGSRRWRDMRAVEKTVKHEGSVTYEIEVGQSLKKIAELQATLQERAKQREIGPAILDAEVVDDAGA